MPLDKFVLLLVIVIAGAAATAWLVLLAATAMQLPPLGWIAFLPAALVGYILWRVISERLHSSEDTHYDRIEK